MDIIQEGDYVLFQMTSDNKKVCKVTPNGTLMFGKFGRCQSSELIGKYPSYINIKACIMMLPMSSTGDA
jgi:hypothetical protein